MPSIPTSRWVTIKEVRPSIKRSMERNTSCSVMASRLAVASSRISKEASGLDSRHFEQGASDGQPLAFSPAQIAFPARRSRYRIPGARSR